MDIEIVKKAGLTDSQAKVYIALLGEKEASPQDIVDHTGENRTTVYMILSRLEELGLVSKIAGKKLLYQAESPSNLRALLAKKQQDLKDAHAELSSALPALNRLYVIAHQKPGVVYLEGIDGLRLIYDEILSHGTEFLILPSKDSRSSSDMNELIERNIKLQKKYGIYARTIYPAIYKQTTDTEQLAQSNVLVRFFGEELHHKAQILMYGNSVAITTFGSGIFTTLITNEAVANTMKGYFESMWHAGVS